MWRYFRKWIIYGRRLRINWLQLFLLFSVSCYLIFILHFYKFSYALIRWYLRSATSHSLACEVDERKRQTEKNNNGSSWCVWFIRRVAQMKLPLESTSTLWSTDTLSTLQQTITLMTPIEYKKSKKKIVLVSLSLACCELFFLLFVNKNHYKITAFRKKKLRLKWNAGVHRGSTLWLSRTNT